MARFLLSGCLLVMVACGGDKGGGGGNQCEGQAAPEITMLSAATEVQINGSFDIIVNVLFRQGGAWSGQINLISGSMTVFDQPLPYTGDLMQGQLFVNARLTGFEDAVFNVTITDTICNLSTTSDNVTVSPMTFAPSFTSQNANPSTLFRGETSNLTFTVDDPDEPYGDTLDYVFAISPSNAGTLSGHDDLTPEAFSFTASTTYLGGVTITVTVTDDFLASDQTTYNLTVVNRAPSIVAAAFGQTNIHRAQTSTLTVSASDPDGDPLEYNYNLSGTAGGSLDVTTGVWLSTTSVTYTPDSATVGDATVTVSVRDGNSGTDSGSDSLTVYNQSPVITSFTASAGSVVRGGNITFSTVAFDPDGDSFTYSYALTGVGSITSSTTNSETYTAPGTGFGQGDVEVTVTDAFSATATSSEPFYVGVWSDVGSGMSGVAGYVQFKIASNDDMFVAYDSTIDLSSPETGTPHAFKYNTGNSTWEELGTQVSADAPLFLALAVDGTTPLVGYTANGLGGNVNVYEWTGSTWSLRNSAAGSGLGDVELHPDSSGMVVAFRENFNSGSVTVKQDSGASWDLVGSSQDVLGIDTLYVGLSVNSSGDINVSAVDIDSTNDLIISRYTGTWSTPTAVFTGTADWPVMASGSSGDYVAYEASNLGEVHVRKYNGTSGDWDMVGNGIPSFFAFQIDVQDDGSTPWVAFMYNSVVYIYTYDTGRGQWDPVGVPMSAGQPSGSPHIQFDSSGRAYVAFYDSVAGGAVVKTVD